ncbi:MAG: AMP-binding protein [Halieaceae bacterium]|jgi:crotonobetaine/carnitine-CoA ligase|nr:AMP-binding protein [Halieaceae bacterium]
MPDQAILANLIADRAGNGPEGPLLTFVSVGTNGELAQETRSYRQLYANGQRLAAGLAGAGMARGDTFALVMQNHPEFVDAMVASSICGTVFVPIDPRTRGDKLAYMLGFPDCRGALVADYALAGVLAVLPQLPKLRWLWVLRTGALAQLPDGSPVPLQCLSDLPAGPAEPLPVAVTDPLEPMQMLFTSGTTGDPKAIVAPYARFDSVASIGPMLGLEDGDVLYTGLSLTHANAQLITLGIALKMGYPCVISRKFTKSRLWDICRRFGCTFFNLLGGMTTAIYSEPPRPDDADNPVRRVLSAGMPAAIWEAFARRFNLEVFEFYGAAEGGMTFNPPGVGPVGSIGKPPPSLEARVVDENDVECPPHVQGEIVFRNADGSCPGVAYFRNPDASSEKTRGGWLRMGDIGHTDEDGWFYYDYRKGGGLRHNGDFINPGFVEKAIAEHPLVDDVFVYGVDAASGVPGEKDLIAAVVALPGRTLDPADLYRHCRAHLEANSVPGYIQLMKEIPKTASEKPQERFCLEAFRNQPEAVFTEPDDKSQRGISQ